MIKLVSKGFFYEDKLDEAIKLYEELIIRTRKENGCISYNLFRDSKDKSILTMIEEWKNQESLDAHMKSDHFTEIVPEIGKFKKSSELNVYKLVI